MFHVKHPQGEVLLAHAKLPEDHVENILDIHPTQKPPQRISRHPQFLRGQFLTLLDYVKGMEERSRGTFQ